MTTNMLCLLFMTITVLIARVTRWVSYMEQELLTLTKYLSSLFCFLCNVIVCYFRFVHCNVFSSSIYGIKVTPLLFSKCPTFIFLLVIGVEQFLNYPTFLMHFSDLILLLWQLISIKNPQYIILFLCICILVFIILYLKTWFEYC
jgi:hypothetical protein